MRTAAGARPASVSKAAPKAATAPDCVMVLFGAAGDLAKRLLVPALYNLTVAGQLGGGFKVLGVDHNERTDDSFRDQLHGFLKSQTATAASEVGKESVEPAAWSRLAGQLFYHTGDFEDPASYAALAQRLAGMGHDGAAPSVLFYLAVSPRFFEPIIDHLADVGLTKAPAGGFRRVVIEKPFGTDLASARALNQRILSRLDEEQIFRIDHFLGKETVRNIAVTRFANGVFEPVWNRLHVDHVQITAAETVGVEDRGAFYERTGALRDMVPNHLFQLLALTAMEQPNNLSAAAVSAERTRLVEAVTVQSAAMALENSVRGQYRAGAVGGATVAAYHDSPNVAAASRTETFVALKLTIDNARWAGVPFYLRTGKAMSGRDTEIAVRFKPAPGSLFKDAGGRGPAGNTLVLQIQPKEGISLEFEAKTPGPEDVIQPVAMDFCYVDAFGHAPSTGYETLLYDCLTGDRTLFKGADEIEFGWRAVQPFLDAWEDGGRVYGYAAGSDGPAEARTLLAREGRAWRPIGT
jgi:glucose-6-phosphate 1-dehydrogenase